MAIDPKEYGKNALIVLGAYLALSAASVPLLWSMKISGRFFLLAGWSFLFLIALSALVASTVWMIRTKLLISKEDRISMDAVRRRLRALESMEKDLAQFLNDFDERSRKYFHATSQKSVHTYFKLRNIDMALQTFFETAGPVREGKAKPGSTSFDIIDAALAGNFEFANSVLSGETQKEQLPFHLLEQKVEELKIALQDSVRDIEREFRSLPKTVN